MAKPSKLLWGISAVAVCLLLAISAAMTYLLSSEDSQTLVATGADQASNRDIREDINDLSAGEPDIRPPTHRGDGSSSEDSTGEPAPAVVTNPTGLPGSGSGGAGGGQGSGEVKSSGYRNGTVVHTDRPTDPSKADPNAKPKPDATKAEPSNPVKKPNKPGVKSGSLGDAMRNAFDTSNGTGKRGESQPGSGSKNLTNTPLQALTIENPAETKEERETRRKVVESLKEVDQQTRLRSQTSTQSTEKITEKTKDFDRTKRELGKFRTEVAKKVDAKDASIREEKERSKELLRELEKRRPDGEQRLRLEAVPGSDGKLGKVIEGREPPEDIGREILRPDSPPADAGRDRYERIIENAFKTVADHPLSTFSIDVDTASYANTRQYLMQSRRLPPADAVRIEELVNYFDYDYAGPKGDDPFASHIEIASCPWEPKHRLVRVALKGQEMHRKERPKSNLVFLVDVSGSMNSRNKLPLVKEGLKMLVKELGDKDRVAMVVYAGAAGLVLDSTVGYEKDTILGALDRLNAGGSTAGGAGIKLAYQTAVDNYIKDGVNRVILCTDGDFNVGVSGAAALEKLAEERAKSGVFLSVMGFGRGNLNDAMMERVTNKGNGNYAYIDSNREAQKVFVDQMSGTLVTIAKDVKIQIEFNPAAVAGYRLIGYENRLLAKEDFNDDTKDAGEIGAGHTVTAMYEVVPAGEKIPTPGVDGLKYQKPTTLTDAAKGGELLTLKLRYKQPTGDTSKLLEFPVKDAGKTADEASGDFKFASAVASFGMLLRGSQYAGDANYDSVLALATAGKGDDKHGYRAELIEMVKQAKKVDERP